MDAVIIFNFPATVNSRVELGIERVARAAQGPALPPKQGSSVFATPKANFISTFAHPGAGLHSCSAGVLPSCLVGREKPGPPTPVTLQRGSRPSPGRAGSGWSPPKAAAGRAC